MNNNNNINLLRKYKNKNIQSNIDFIKFINNNYNLGILENDMNSLTIDEICNNNTH